MTGETHVFIANLAISCLDMAKRHILLPRWGGIEAGATLSDEFRILWEPVDLNDNRKQLVHRCYIDSDDIRDHGCITRLMNHYEGCISYINDYYSGDLGYTEDEFLENLGMFLGIISHHIADLNSPLHVGHTVNFKKMGFSSLSKLHNKVEWDIEKYSRISPVTLKKIRSRKITEDYFWSIAKDTYKNHFIHLEDIYSGKNSLSVETMVSDLVSSSIYQTANTWNYILKVTKMDQKKWSMQPLL